MQTAVRAIASITSTLACAATVLATPPLHAATFRTFLNDPAGMAAAMGSRSIKTTETFTDVADGQLLTATPDQWNSFTVELIGTGSSAGNPAWGASRYCQNLSSGSCIAWNANATPVPGVYGVFDGPGTGVAIKLSSPTIAGFTFGFTDWNDPSDGVTPSERSYFEVIASDGTTVAVHGAPQPVNAPPQTFGVALSQTDIAAGVYLQEIRWIGMPGQTEVVGFYHFATFTNPVLAPRPVQPIPTLSVSGMALLSVSIAGVFLFLRRRER